MIDVLSFNPFKTILADLCDNFCRNEGVCLKDKTGTPYCQCAGSFTGPCTLPSVWTANAAVDIRATQV